MTDPDLGDGYLAQMRALNDLAALLLRERDEERARADGYLDLIHTAVSHHLARHPDCHTWESR